jgi:pimeloyl-ACP methyl ester carboxylesterase
MTELAHHNIQTNGIRLHVVTAGDPKNEPVILLHGFPEYW